VAKWARHAGYLCVAGRSRAITTVSERRGRHAQRQWRLHVFRGIHPRDLAPRRERRAHVGGLLHRVRSDVVWHSRWPSTQRFEARQSERARRLTMAGANRRGQAGLGNCATASQGCTLAMRPTLSGRRTNIRRLSTIQLVKSLTARVAAKHRAAPALDQLTCWWCWTWRSRGGGST
jgi:hypothetical protein